MSAFRAVREAPPQTVKSFAKAGSWSSAFPERLHIQFTSATHVLVSAAVARPAKNTAWNEVFALILLGVGTLLFLALISYVPQDVPASFWFSKVSSRALPTQNFIGPAGAIIAGFCYFMVGAASYFLAVVLLGFGAAKLFHPQLRVSKRAGWIALFIISGACLLHLQKWFLRDWPSAFNIQGPGGWV